MLFNSLDFAFFLPIVFILYWFVTGNLKLQNFIIVASSYVFYSWWDWRFLSLILLSTMVDYAVGIGLSNQKDKRKRKMLLGTSILVNLGMLGFFKYYNFFLDNFIVAFSFFGAKIPANSLNIILPIGISFYTFQTLSYTIDIYKQKLAATRDFIAFSAFVSFFPQLVAGPIERATHLLPQFYTKRRFEYSKAADGLKQVLWGLFKKLVIADNCAIYANNIFNNSAEYSGSTLIVGALFFTFQIYGDFSGYSDIAIGISKLFGFNLIQNFAFPYFSRDIAEFWRRWHISLSTWFRDYLYIPLGGSKGGTWRTVRNIFIIFIVSGFWHGANWTFIIWGALNALYFLPLLILTKNRNNLEIVAKGKHLPTVNEFFNISMTFCLTVLAWIFFRVENLKHGIGYLSEIFSVSLFSFPHFRGNRESLATILFVLGFMVIEWIGREKQYAIADIGLNWPPPIRLLFYYCIAMVIFLFCGQKQQFIYFQF